MAITAALVCSPSSLSAATNVLGGGVKVNVACTVTNGDAVDVSVLTCRPFLQPPLDRVDRDAGLAGDHAGAAASLRLGGQVLTPLLLIQQGPQLLVCFGGGERFHALQPR